MRAFSFFAGALALLVAAAADIEAQWPGEVRGDVLDALSGRPVPSADVRLRAAPSTLSDAAGAFRIRAVEAGAYVLEVRASGYAAHSREVVVRNGTLTHVRVELMPETVELEGLVAEVEARPPGVRTLAGDRLAAVPARTAGDLVSAVGGVQVTARGRGGSEVPSIRGSAGDAVLVLVDGVPINDPLTGEADLSTVPAGAVAAVHVLPGGRSARYGARAEGGVILIETVGVPGGDAVGAGRALSVTAGSLGERAAEVAWRQDLPLGSLDVGGGIRRLEGRFGFDQPADAGGGRALRENARADGEHARVAWYGEGEALRFRMGISGERLERGLPGRSFAPSRSAEQELERLRVSGSLETGARGPWTFGVDGHLAHQTVEHRDPAPPFGDPFDDRTTLLASGAEARGTRSLAAGTTGSLGLAVSHLRVRSTQLDAGTGDPSRTDAGAWLGLTHEGPWGLTLSTTARADRSGLPARGYLSHDVGLGWTASGWGVRGAHRSAFSPPTLGDQYFREGVGVAPNPELEAERVPSEWTLALRHERTLAGAEWSVEAEAYRGDIRGMIVWLPDFRFVWSPRNLDVRRRGLDVTAGMRRPAAGLDLAAHLSWNRTTYDRPDQEDVQVVYRPALTGGGTASWSGERWRASVSTELVGARYPVPNRVNELPAFWTTDLTLVRRWRTEGGTLEVRLDVERIFDHEDSLIHAFPDPGRTARLTLRLAR